MSTVVAIALYKRTGPRLGLQSSNFGAIFWLSESLLAKMLLIVLDHLGIWQLFAIMMSPGFPDISRTSGTFLISGAFLRLLESPWTKMSIITFN